MGRPASLRNISKRTLASQANGRRSQGPKTEAGKCRSSQNARRHGLRSRTFHCAPKHNFDPHFQNVLDQHIARFGPSDDLENALVRQMAMAAWNLHQLNERETALWNQAIAHHPGPDPIAQTALAFTNLANGCALRLLGRHQSRVQRTFQRAFDNFLSKRESENKPGTKSEPTNRPAANLLPFQSLSANNCTAINLPFQSEPGETPPSPVIQIAPEPALPLKYGLPRDSTVVAIDNAVRVYEGGVEALRGVSLELPAGRITALLGRSGCGKTTLLNLCGAMDFPTSGSIEIEGRATSAMKDAELTQLRRTRIGFIFQFFQLLPSLTALENIELPLLLAGARNTAATARERLAWVGLPEKADALPYQLSGGQMQRVAIARALVHNPRVLVADEPTGNLDTASGDIVLKLLTRAADEFGAAVIMATHSAEAAAIADRRIRMRDGRIESIEP